MARSIAAALAVAMSVIAAGASQTANAADLPIQWKIQSLWQAGSINQRVFEDFCRRVGEMTGGRLLIEPLPVGTIVAYNETLDAVAAGLLDGQHGGTGYFAGKDAAFALLGDISGAYDEPRQMQMWLEYGGGKELARELYQAYGLYFVGGVWWGAESIPAKKAIHGVEEFKGVKIRVPEGMSQEIFRLIGAAPVNIPGSEVYTALDQGVVDAADWGTLGMNQDLGYHKIAPFPLYPGFHSMPMADLAVNLGRWNQLSDELKLLVELAVRDFARDMIGRIAIQDTDALAQAKAAGVQPVNWSAAERAKFRAVARTVWKQYAERSDMARRVYDSHIAFLTRLGLLGATP